MEKYIIGTLKNNNLKIENLEIIENYSEYKAVKEYKNNPKYSKINYYDIKAIACIENKYTLIREPILLLYLLNIDFQNNIDEDLYAYIFFNYDKNTDRYIDFTFELIDKHDKPEKIYHNYQKFICLFDLQLSVYIENDIFEKMMKEFI